MNPPDAPRPAPPDPPSGHAQNRLVWNPFWGEYLGNAPARMQRREGTTDCPFCADLITGRVPPGTQAWIRPNDFPAIRPPDGEAFVLIYSADHNRTFARLDVPDVLRVLGLWQQVYREQSPRYPAVMSWETAGAEIGQTQFHPHGQTFALAVLPGLLACELRAVEESGARGEGCPFCAEVAAESGGERVVLQGEHWLGFVPYYARYPYQVRLTPRRHTSNIVGVSADGPAAEELARGLLRLVRAYDRIYQAPMPYMLALHQLGDPRFHVHFEILPVGRAPGKLKFAASSESAWGFWINDSLPGAKAAELRDAVAKEPL